MAVTREAVVWRVMAGDYSEHRVRTILQVTRKGPAGWVASRKVVGSPDIVGSHSCWRGQRHGQFRGCRTAKELGLWILVKGHRRAFTAWGAAASGRCLRGLHLDSKTVLDVELTELEEILTANWRPTNGENLEGAARKAWRRRRRRRRRKRRPVPSASALRRRLALVSWVTSANR